MTLMVIRDTGETDPIIDPVSEIPMAIVNVEIWKAIVIPTTEVITQIVVGRETEIPSSGKGTAITVDVLRVKSNSMA